MSWSNHKEMSAPTFSLVITAEDTEVKCLIGIHAAIVSAFSKNPLRTSP